MTTYVLSDSLYVLWNNYFWYHWMSLWKSKILVLCLTLFCCVLCIWYQSHVSKFMLIMHLNSCSKNLGHDRVVTYGIKAVGVRCWYPLIGLYVRICVDLSPAGVRCWYPLTGLYVRICDVYMYVRIVFFRLKCSWEYRTFWSLCKVQGRAWEL